VEFVLEGEGAGRRVKGFAMVFDEDAVRARKRSGAKEPRSAADAWFKRI